MSKFKKYIVTVIIVCSFYSGPGVSAKIMDDPRGAFISKLINDSSGSKQVNKSNNPEVKKSYQQAKDLLNKASEQFTLGNIEQGSALLDKSAKMMFSAIRLATPKTVKKEKDKHEYYKRKKSFKALRDALNRITAESTNGNNVKHKINIQLDKILESSNKLERSGNHKAAKIKLDKAYYILQQSIESLRGGQTLVRSLNFANPEEEYQYELDRNDTHKMLMKLLLDEKKSSEYTKKSVLKFTQQADSLRQKAIAATLDKQFEEAIKLLEQSTKQLVRAIRSAGVYIPG